MTAAYCAVPPEGWYCKRDAGHDGPCAALPAADLIAAGEEWLDSGSIEPADERVISGLLGAFDKATADLAAAEAKIAKGGSVVQKAIDLAHSSPLSYEQALALVLTTTDVWRQWQEDVADRDKWRKEAAAAYIDWQYAIETRDAEQARADAQAETIEAVTAVVTELGAGSIDGKHAWERLRRILSDTTPTTETGQ